MTRGACSWYACAVNRAGKTHVSSGGRSTGPQDRKWWAQLGILSTMGIAMAISVATGVLGGHFLDQWLGTKVFFWVGLLVGIMAAYRTLWVFYTRYMRERPPQGPTQAEKKE